MQTLTPGSILGHAVRRREDPRLVTGTGNYVDDTQPEGCLHIAFVRSTLAHATIRSLDVEAAAAAPGVVAVLTAADLGLPDRVGFPMVAATLARPPLATGRVRFVGEAVALVIAESPGQAEDAAQLVGLDLEPLPVVVDPEVARRADSQMLFPEHGSNIAGHFDSTRGMTSWPAPTSRFAADSSINGWRQCRWSLKRSWSCLKAGASWSGRP